MGVLHKDDPTVINWTILFLAPIEGGVENYKETDFPTIVS